MYLSIIQVSIILWIFTEYVFDINVQFLTFTWIYYMNYPRIAYVKILQINKCIVKNDAENYDTWFTSQLFLHLHSRQRFVSVTTTLRKPGLHCGHLGEGHMAKNEEFWCMQHTYNIIRACYSNDGWVIGWMVWRVVYINGEPTGSLEEADTQHGPVA